MYNEKAVGTVVEMMEGKNEIVLVDASLQSAIGLAERCELAKRGFIVKHNGKIPSQVLRKDIISSSSFSPSPAPKREKRTLSYIMPRFSDEVLALLGCGKDWQNCRSINIRLAGPHGTGKSEFVYEIAKLAGFGKVYRINGHQEKSSIDFLGDKTVEVDKTTSQSIVGYQKGVLELAMTHGLKKDEKGYAVLEDGKVVVEGSPALLFLDEYASLSEHIGMLLNRILEVPLAGRSRGIDLDVDGGRQVLSHPGFAIILAGNTLGKGCENSKTSGYTGQDNQLDDSTLDRIAVTYHFGYNLEAERMYLEDAIEEDSQVTQFVKFINDIRKSRIDETVMTLLSTRMIVSVCDNIKAFGRAKFPNHIPLAIYRTIFSGLREVEKDAWAEKIQVYFNYDVRNIDKKDKSMFFVY